MATDEDKLAEAVRKIEQGQYTGHNRARALVRRGLAPSLDDAHDKLRALGLANPDDPEDE